jgi:hypothetical protein
LIAMRRRAFGPNFDRHATVARGARERRALLRSLCATAVLAGLIAALGAASVTAAPASPPVPIWPAASAVALPPDAVSQQQVNPLPFLAAAVGLRSVACTSPGNCVAVGGYANTNQDTNGDAEYFPIYATESAGVWAAAHPVAMPALYDTDPSQQRAFLSSISCPAAGDCVAVGSYTDHVGNNQAMIATESGGSWGTARELTALPAGADSVQGALGAILYSVSCVRVGDCLAVGTYKDATDARQAMVVAQSAGTWGAATEAKLPGNANAASGGQYARLTSVSCTPNAGRQIGRLYEPGNCVAVGTYTDNTTADNDLTMVATEKAGAWTAAPLALPSNASTTQPADLGGFNNPAVSCTSLGSCVVVASYVNGNDGPVLAALHAEETGGTWGPSAQFVPPADEGQGVDTLDSVSCTGPGNCAVGGFYAQLASPTYQPLVGSELGGQWAPSSPLTLPADAGSVSGGGGIVGIQFDNIAAVTCSSATSCVAVGSYSDSNDVQQPMVVSTVAPLAVATTTLPPGMVGSAYSATLKGTGGGGGGYSWSLASESLPAGLKLDASTGVISGTPTTVGTSNFTVALSESDLAPAGQQATAALSIAILARSSANGGSTSPTGKATIAKVTVKKTKVTVRVACAGAASDSCTGTLALSTTEHLTGRKITAISAAKKTMRTVTLGHTTYTVTAGASVFTIKLNSTANRLLATHHHYSAKLTLTAAKTVTTTTKTITLKR